MADTLIELDPVIRATHNAQLIVSDILKNGGLGADAHELGSAIPFFAGMTNGGVLMYIVENACEVESLAKPAEYEANLKETQQILRGQLRSALGPGLLRLAA